MMSFSTLRLSTKLLLYCPIHVCRCVLIPLSEESIVVSHKFTVPASYPGFGAVELNALDVETARGPVRPKRSLRAALFGKDIVDRTPGKPTVIDDSTLGLPLQESA
jgi:hypothetical protein